MINETSVFLTRTAIVAVKVLVPRLAKILDLFLPEAEIRIEVTGRDYAMKRIPFLWLWRREEGSKFVMVLQGKPGFCEAAALYLTASARTAAARQSEPDATTEAVVVAEMTRRSKAERVSDVFRKQNQMLITVAGSSSMSEQMLMFWEAQQGAILRLTIRGKPAFCRNMAAHLGEHAAILQKILTEAS